MTEITQPSVLETLKDPRQYVKAILAFAVPFVGSLVVAYEDAKVTPDEWQGAFGIAIPAFIAVFALKNAPVAPQHRAS